MVCVLCMRTLPAQLPSFLFFRVMETFGIINKGEVLFFCTIDPWISVKSTSTLALLESGTFDQMIDKKLVDIPRDPRIHILEKVCI